LFIHIAIEPVNKSLSLLAGGALMVVASGILGEWATFDAGSVFSSRSLLAWGYLLVFGSLVGFTAYHGQRQESEGPARR